MTSALGYAQGDFCSGLKPLIWQGFYTFTFFCESNIGDIGFDQSDFKRRPAGR